MLFKKAIKLLSITILSLFFTVNTFALEPKDFVQQTVDKAAKALNQLISCRFVSLTSAYKPTSSSALGIGYSE